MDMERMSQLRQSYQCNADRSPGGMYPTLKKGMLILQQTRNENQKNAFYKSIETQVDKANRNL